MGMRSSSTIGPSAVRPIFWTNRPPRTSSRSILFARLSTESPAQRRAKLGRSPRPRKARRMFPSSSTAITRSRRSASPISTATGATISSSSSPTPTSTPGQVLEAQPRHLQARSLPPRRQVPLAARPGLGDRAGHLVFALRGLRSRRRRQGRGGRQDGRGRSPRRRRPVQTGPEYLTILDGATGKPITRSIGRRAMASPGDRGLQLRLAEPARRRLPGRQDALPDRRAGHLQHHHARAYQLRRRASSKSSGGGTTRKEPRDTGARVHIGCTPPTSTATDATKWCSARPCSTTTARSLWSTGLGHPDHFYVGDIDPRGPGWRSTTASNPAERRTACAWSTPARGKILWGHDEPTRHVHSSGLCADIDAGAAGLGMLQRRTRLQGQTLVARLQGQRHLDQRPRRPGSPRRLLGRRPAARTASSADASPTTAARTRQHQGRGQRGRRGRHPGRLARGNHRQRAGRTADLHDHDPGRPTAACA